MAITKRTERARQDQPGRRDRRADQATQQQAAWASSRSWFWTRLTAAVFAIVWRPRQSGNAAALYRTATALAGEPTAPVTLSGTLVNRNS